MWGSNSRLHQASHALLTEPARCTQYHILEATSPLGNGTSMRTDEARESSITQSENFTLAKESEQRCFPR